MPTLKELEGQTVVILFPNPNRPSGVDRINVKLLSTDDNGIWVEDQTLTNRVLASMELPAAPALITVFYPYAAIHAILGNLPGLSLSEKAFGV